MYAPSIKKHYLLYEHSSTVILQRALPFQGLRFQCSCRRPPLYNRLHTVSERKENRCQFTEEEGPRGTGRTAGPFAVLSLFTPSVGGLLNWLAWPGTLKTIQNHLRPSQHVLQGASALFRDPRTQGDLYVPWTMVCRSVQFHADSLIFQTADCS